MKHIFICMPLWLFGMWQSRLKGRSNDLHVDLDFHTFSVVHTRLLEICVDPDVRVMALQRVDI